MSAEDNLSQELFFTVHRGIATTPNRIFHKKDVGMHWSAKKDVAETFATDSAGDSVFDRVSSKLHTTKPYVFHAEVPISSVERRTHLLKQYKVGGEFAKEEEVPVRAEAPIRITGRTTLRQAKSDSRYEYSKSRKRTYNPPREAKA